MGLGKTIRLARLFAHPSGRLCSVAVDHFMGYQAGLPASLRDLPTVIAALVAGGPDTITMHRGAATSCWPKFAGRIPLILQSIIGRLDDTANEHIAEPADAVRLGADAFATCAFVRGATEAAYLRRVGDFVRQAEVWDIPVIVHIYPRRFSAGGAEISFTPEDITWAVRCALECGADVIKVPYCGERSAYAQIVRECPVPVVAAGGPQAGSLEEALAMAAEVVAGGARGMVIGRNIWGVPRITAALRAFKAVIHDDRSPHEALALAGG